MHHILKVYLAAISGKHANTCQADGRLDGSKKIMLCKLWVHVKKLKFKKINIIIVYNL